MPNIVSTMHSMIRSAIPIPHVSASNSITLLCFDPVAVLIVTEAAVADSEKKVPATVVVLVCRLLIFVIDPPLVTSAVSKRLYASVFPCVE